MTGRLACASGGVTGGVEEATVETEVRSWRSAATDGDIGLCRVSESH